MAFVQDPIIELSYFSSVYIKQQIEILEMISGCETPNRYHVYGQNLNRVWTYLFKCKEESGWCSRNCCPSDMRPFRMKMKHVNSSNITDHEFSDNKTFAILDKPFKCSCFCLDR